MSSRTFRDYACDLCGGGAEVPVPDGMHPSDAPLPEGWGCVDGGHAIPTGDGYLEICPSCVGALHDAIVELRAHRKDGAA